MADWSRAFVDHEAAVQAATDAINETADAKDWSDGWRSLALDLVAMAERSSDPWYWSADAEDFWADLRELWADYEGPSGWSDLSLAWGSSESAAEYAEQTSVNLDDVGQAVSNIGSDLVDTGEKAANWIPWVIGGTLIVGVLVYFNAAGKGAGKAWG